LPMSSSASSSSLPSGLAVLTTFPDVLFIPEIIFGGLVWILVASSRVPVPMLQGWVMFVSVFCFVMTISLLCLYICGAHGGGGCWVTLVRACDQPRGLPCLAVPCRAGSCCCTPNCSLGTAPLGGHEARAQSWSGTMEQKMTARCVLPPQVFAFVATLVYVIHKVFSLLRWKSS
ncbi:MAL protein, partial [Pomatostomus ruficeps]|nr:MAL protein [Pomatostomus ruficeps]